MKSADNYFKMYLHSFHFLVWKILCIFEQEQKQQHATMIIIKSLLLHSASILSFKRSSLTMTTKSAPVRDALAETSVTGKFIRTASGFREVISNEHPIFKPEFGRYHLYISLACPWANRCLAVLNLKGLQKCISHTVVHPTWQKTKPNDAADTHNGWAFFQSGVQYVVYHDLLEYFCELTVLIPCQVSTSLSSTQLVTAL